MSVTIISTIVTSITKKFLSPLKRECTMLDDILVTKIDSKMNNILSKYIQAKRNHEHTINQEKQKEQFYLQKAKSLIDEVMIPAMESVCHSFKKHSGIDCIVTQDLKNFKFSDKGNSVLFMTCLIFLK